MNVLTCTKCGARFSDTIFHVTTSTGHVYCEQCLLRQMAMKEGSE